MAMVYDITSKLKFNEDPVIRIRDTELTVRSDADILLQIIDIMQNKDEMEASVEAIGLLFSEEDKEKLSALKLKIGDYMEVISTAISMAMGEDPDGEPEKN